MEECLGIAAAVVVAFTSASLQCCVKRGSQLLLAEGLEQARHCTPRNELLAHGLVRACSDEDDRHVLTAIGVKPDLASAAVRMSLGALTDDECVDRVADVFPALVMKARQFAAAS